MINRLLLTGDKFKTKMHLGLPGFTYSDCGPFSKDGERIYNLRKQEGKNIFIKVNWIKFAFNLTWLIELLKIYLEEQLLIK